MHLLIIFRNNQPQYQLPAKGPAKIPTASSIQIRASANKMIIEIMSFEESDLPELSTRCTKKAAPKSKIPATRKSEGDQFHPSA